MERNFHMNKNLVVFHLESLSNVIYQNNADLFPNLKKFSQQCYVYANYYSTSTSTFMVMSDLAYGDVSIFEKSKDYTTLIEKRNREKNLFEQLHMEGYYSEIIAPPFLTESEKQRYIDIFGNVDTYFFADTYKEFREEIEKALKKKSFAIYITEFISHIGYSKFRGKSKGWTDKWKKGYEMLDDLLGFLLKRLEDASVLEKTVVIAYGDHGDDFYFHKFNGGFTHAIEPYSSMIRTPLFVYSGSGYKEKNELISTTSLRKLTEGLVKGAQPDIKETYVFARNLYTAQKRENNGLNKAFCVTNGEYLLMASYNGIELYNSIIDSGNGFNILDLFKLKKGRIKCIRNVNLMGGSHIGYIIGDDFYKEVQGVYEELSDRLKTYVLKMYDEIGERNRVKEIKQQEINYTSRIRYYKIVKNYIYLICAKMGLFR